MSFAFTLFVLTVACFIWVRSNGVAIPACNTIPTTTIDYKQMIALSPFNVYSTSFNIYNCAKVMFIGPGSSQANYTGSAIIIQGNYTLTSDLHLVNRTQINTLVCPFKVRASYNVFYNHLVDEREASACVLTCAPNGRDYEGVVCMGRSDSDYLDITKFLARTLPGVPNITNAQRGCAQPTTCNFFTD